MTPLQILEQKLFTFDKPHTPGCMVAVVQEGDIIYQRGFGRANVEFDIPWTLDTKYRIASITKQFVGAALLLLEDAGKLNLDNDIRTYLPEMPDYGKAITLRHLLTMTSGIRHEELSIMNFLGENTASLEDLYTLVTKSPLHFETGSYSLYSCANYRLATRILERVTGKSFDGVLQELIFKPLGMKDSKSHPDYNHVLPNLAHLYHPEGELYRREQTEIQMAGDGSIISTVNGLVLWVKNLQQNSLGITARLTTPGQLKDGRKTNYGLGIGVMHYRGLQVWEHSGAFGTYLFHLPEKDFSVILFCNRMDINRWELAREIADTYVFGEASSAATWLGYDSFKLSAGKLESVQGHYVNGETGYSFTLEMWRGALRLSFMGSNEILEPVSADEFASVYIASAFRLRFGQDDSVLYADVGKNGWTQFKRVTEDFKVTNVLEYTGTYYNKELDAYQTITAQNGELVLTVRHGCATKLQQRLEPLDQDIFQAGEIALKFLRDVSGGIVGVNESINLARDVWFSRWRARDG